MNEGIIEPVSDNNTSDNTQYLPYGPVVREQRYATKVRIVYEASVKTSGQFSLNGTLHSGPCLLQLFQEVLCFLLGQVALVADIHQTFLQIEIGNLHRDYRRFLRYENMENPNLMNIYRFTRLVFGLICSPFILNATVKVHIQNFINDETVRILTQFLRDLYVGHTASSLEVLLKRLNFTVFVSRFC